MRCYLNFDVYDNYVFNIFCWTLSLYNIYIVILYKMSLSFHFRNKYNICIFGFFFHWLVLSVIKSKYAVWFLFYNKFYLLINFVLKIAGWMLILYQ